MNRFFSHTRYEDRGYGTLCLIWTSTLVKGGYGQFRLQADSRRVTAHVYAYALLHGDEYMLSTVQNRTHEVDHLCRQAACVNVDHLERVPRPVNMQRMFDAHRTEFCKHGHLRAEHERTNGRGYHYCRECARRSNAAWVRRKQEGHG